MMNPQHSIIHTLIVPFLIGMIAFTAYMVYKTNPEIMDPVPFLKVIQEEAVSGELRIRSAAEVKDSTLTTVKKPDRISHRWVEVNSELFQRENLPGAVRYWSLFREALLVKGDDWVGVLEPDGVVRWTFDLPKEAKWAPGAPAVLGHQFIAAAEGGPIYALDIDSGTINWFWSSGQRAFLNPMVFGKQLVIFESSADPTWALKILNTETLEMTGQLEKLDFPLSGTPHLSSDGILYYSTRNGSLNSLQLRGLKELWQAEKTSGYRGPISVQGDRLYVSNEDGLLLIFDRKNGKKISEIDLETPLISPIRFVDGSNLAVALNQNNYLVTFDTNAQKRIWRYNVKQSESLPVLELFRMSSESLEKLSFQSEIRGWSVWTYCQGHFLCGLDAKNGVPLQRFDLKGQPTGEFRIQGDNNRLYVPLSGSGAGGGRGGSGGNSGNVVAGGGGSDGAGGDGSRASGDNSVAGEASRSGRSSDGTQKYFGAFGPPPPKPSPAAAGKASAKVN